MTSTGTHPLLGPGGASNTAPSPQMQSLDLGLLKPHEVEAKLQDGELLSWAALHPTPFDRKTLKGEHGPQLQNLAHRALWDGEAFLGDASTSAYLKVKSDTLEVESYSFNKRLIFETEKANQPLWEALQEIEALQGDLKFVATKASDKL